MILVMIGATLPVFILNEAAARQYAWNSATTIAVLVISGLVWIFLVLWQWQVSKRVKLRFIQPQLPFSLLKDRVLLSIFTCTILTGFVIFITIVSIPLRAQIVNLYDAVKSGILLLPLMGGMAVGSALGGAISVKKNLTFWTLVASSTLTTVGTALMSTIPGSLTPSAKQYGFEAILGLGLGMNLSTSTLVVSLQAKFEEHAIAQGLTAQMRVFGGSIGVAVSFIVLNTRIQQTLQSVLSPAELADFYKSPITILKLNILQKIKVRETYIDAFAIDMRICIGVAAASFLVALCTYQRHPPSMQRRLDELEALYTAHAAEPESVEV